MFLRSIRRLSYDRRPHLGMGLQAGRSVSCYGPHSPDEEHMQSGKKILFAGDGIHYSLSFKYRRDLDELLGCMFPPLRSIAPDVDEDSSQSLVTEFADILAHAESIFE